MKDPSQLINKSMRTLEFDRVLELLQEKCGSDGSRERAAALTPSPHLDEVQERQQRTAQAYTLVGRKGSPPAGGVKDIRESVAHAVKGATLTMLELLRVAAVLKATRQCIDYIEEDTEDAPGMRELFSLLTAQKTLEERIVTSILNEEEVADLASPELARIRRQISSASQRIRDTLQKMIRSPSYQKYLQDPIITIRASRFVIPVKAEFRSEVPGLVHDTSGSGATCFVEPMPVVEANNELKILYAKEEEEIARILAELSAAVGARADDILNDYDLLVEIDFTFAKGRLARAQEAVMPILNGTGEIELRKARHPLIPRESVVPIDLKLGAGVDTLVITGPNTGGKTVTLKTLGLLSLMAAAGLHVPAEEGTRVAVFTHVLCDIGDEQSIEQSLSTFSGHITTIVSILATDNKNSLVLLDELGAGTDPVEGAALAMAILERLRSQGARIAATTHYPELKLFALNTKGVQNASCEFDVETLRPTYKLITGTPGKSNAYAISARLGIGEDVIERAKELTSGEALRFEDVMEQFEARRQQMERQLDEARRLNYEAQTNKTRLEKERAEFERTKEREIEKATTEARRMVAMARTMYTRTMDELAELKKQKDAPEFAARLAEARASLRREINRAADEADPVIEREEPQGQPPQDLRVGDTVRIRSLDKTAEVLTAPDAGGFVQVRAGIIKTKVKLSDLELVDEQKKMTEKFVARRRKGGDKQVSTLPIELDLRGQNGEDGCLALDKYLDEASLAGLESVTVIHGKGTGALRSAIWQHLKGHPHVAAFRQGVYGEGDAGVTVVELR
ncbi:MAG TPA: endonuclease MutS2 [Terriglobales bacterium]|nr:endonuclease MutS2 [Terriglobales bacterium]